MIRNARAKRSASGERKAIGRAIPASFRVEVAIGRYEPAGRKSPNGERRPRRTRGAPQQSRRAPGKTGPRQGMPPQPSGEARAGAGVGTGFRNCGVERKGQPRSVDPAGENFERVPSLQASERAVRHSSFVWETFAVGLPSIEAGWCKSPARRARGDSERRSQMPRSSLASRLESERRRGSLGTIFFFGLAASYRFPIPPVFSLSARSCRSFRHRAQEFRLAFPRFQ